MHPPIYPPISAPLPPLPAAVDRRNRRRALRLMILALRLLAGGIALFTLAALALHTLTGAALDAPLLGTPSWWAVRGAFLMVGCLEIFFVLALGEWLQLVFEGAGGGG